MKKSTLSIHDHQLVPFVILILIAGLITTNLWLYFKAQKKISIPEPMVTPPTAIATDDMSGWQTYTNNDFALNFKYPANWTVSPCSYTDCPISISHQVSGQVYGGDGDISIQIKKPKATNQTLKQWFKDNAEMTPEKISTVLDQVKKGFGDVGPGYATQTYHHEDTTVVSLPAIVQTITSTQPIYIEGPAQTSKSYYFVKDSLLYDVSASVPNGSQTQKLLQEFDKFVSTFRFTDDMSGWQTYKTSQYKLQFEFPSDLVYIGPEGGEIIGPLSSSEAIEYATDLVVGTPANELLFTLDIIPTSENDGNFYVLNHIQQVLSRDTSKYSKSTVSIDNTGYDKYSRLQNRQPNNHTQIKDVYVTSQNGFTYIITLYDLQIGEKILSTFKFTDDKIAAETYTNSALGFSIQHPEGWIIDDTSTPNKVWFNPSASERLDSIEIASSDKSLSNWLVNYYPSDIRTTKKMTIDGYPAEQIELTNFNLQETAIQKGAKLYIIRSNSDIKELNLLSTFQFTK